MTERQRCRSAQSRRRRRRLRRLEPRSGAARPRRRADRRRRQPALGRARERARPPAVAFVEGSITDDDVARAAAADLDYVFHLATYHGNQSSMADPLADHEHNTLLDAEALRGDQGPHARLERVVYASAGAPSREKTFDGARRPPRTRPSRCGSTARTRSRRSSASTTRTTTSPTRHRPPTVKARFQNVYGPGEMLGAGRWRGTVNTVWRNVARPSSTRRCTTRRCRSRTAASPRAT